jgi:hypothetical protein
MSITELIKAVGGDEAIEFQNLDTDAIRWEGDKNGVVKIEFGTRVLSVAHLLAGDPLSDKIGLVVWFDRKAALKAVKAAKEGSVTP